MLTIAAVKAARPMARAYKMGDSGGLFLYVAPGGLKSWRVKYRRSGREQLIVVGRYPDQSLADARAARDVVRAQLMRGEDPSRASQAAGGRASAGHDFESIARAWHAHQAGRWSNVHARDVMAALERDIFPAIGKLEPGAIDAPAVLRCLRSIEARGRVEKARRDRQRISAIFAFAISEGVAAYNPAAIVRDGLQPKPIEQRHPAILDIDGLRAMMQALASVPGRSSAADAARMLAFTAARLNSVLGMCWSEIEGIDWAAGKSEAPLWRIPAARMKLSRAKKAIDRFDHPVPLSRQAVTLLLNLRTRTSGALVFAGKAPGSAIDGRTIRDLHRAAATRIGAGPHVPHGWRASFSTIMNERFPADRAAIDLALAHAPKDKVEAAYNRAEHLSRRRTLMQDWADMILPDPMAG